MRKTACNEWRNAERKKARRAAKEQEDEEEATKEHEHPDHQRADDVVPPVVLLPTDTIRVHTFSGVNYTDVLCEARCLIVYVVRHKRCLMSESIARHDSHLLLIMVASSAINSRPLRTMPKSSVL